MQWVCWSWEVYSANLAGHVPGKSIQVCLARLVRGSLLHPVQEGSGDEVPALPGRVWGISLHLPAGSAWHLDAICWEAAHVMGSFMRGGLSWGPAASPRGEVMPPDFFMYPPERGAV